MPKKKNVRDAGSGEYVKKKEATKRPKETVTETDRPRKSPPKKKK